MFHGIVISSVIIICVLSDTCRASPIAANPVVTGRLSKAEQILRYMNTTVAPCEDFYEFTCGNYATYHSAFKEGRTLLLMVREMQTSLDDKITQILLSDDEHETVIDKKVKGVYRSCLDLPALMKKYPDTYKTLTDEIGPMPALVGGEWREDEFDWLQAVAGIKHKYGLDKIIDCIVTADFTNNSVNALYIGESQVKFESVAIYLEKEYAPIIEEYKAEVATNLEAYLGLDEDLADETAEEIVNFEISLARGMPDNRLVNHLDEMYTPTSIQELQEKYMPHWNASEQILRTFGSIPPFRMYINEVYQHNLLTLLKQTPKRVVANYLHYNFLKNFFLEFPKAVSEKKKQYICLVAMKKHFSKNFDNMVYRKYNLRETEPVLNDMWLNIKSAFRDTLDSERLNWLNEDTRKSAIEKLEAMQLVIKSYEDYDFNKNLGHLQVDGGNFLNNLKAILATKGDKARALINEAPQQMDYSHIISQTPAYLSTTNTIQIPVYFLQPYYVWSKSFPKAYNFAALGYALAHELTHGFDDNGRDFDAHGNVHSWWDEASSLNFVDRTKCFTNQYKQYVFGGRKLPELTVQRENIADNGGVRLAYEAYLKWYNNALDSKQISDSESFPGLNYTNKQLFFISHSHMWCSDTHPDYMAHRADDIHTPEKFRIIGALSNFKEFAKEFNCPRGSGMNPETKCEIF